MCTKHVHTLVHFSFYTRTQGACTRHWNTGTFTGQPGTGRGVSKQETLAQPLAHSEADHRLRSPNPVPILLRAGSHGRIAYS